jgi:hypothetical protein
VKVKLVRPEKGQLDIEFFLAVLALIALSGMAILHWVPRQYLPVPRCTFHAVTGQPCLTCGGTRAAEALAHFDLREAFRCNPLVALGLVLSGPLVVWGALAWSLKLPRPRLEFKGRRERWALYVAVFLLVAGNWAYLIAAGI